MSTGQQLGLIGNSIKVQSLPTASAETFGAGNRFYTLIGQQEGYITGHTYHTVVANDVYSWEDVAGGNYNMLDNIPVINQDLTVSGFMPVANSYYRHTGTTTASYTNGVIYYYNGTEYKALDGSGGGIGISDVQVNGTSVVTDGVANILPASESSSGIVTDGEQTFKGQKTIISSKSGAVLTLKRSKPSSGRACPSIDFDSITSSDGVYSFRVGMAEVNKLSFRHMSGFSGTYFDFANYDGKTFRIDVNNSGSNKGRVNCGSVSDQLYLFSQGAYNAVPITDGTLMSTPSTWSSGTSGSVTLAESGTYQIYMNNGENNINFGVVYWDGNTNTYTQIVMDNAHTGYFATIVGGVITTYDVNLTADSTTPNTNTIYYRRIGK